MDTKPKSRFSRLMIAALAGAIALGGVGAPLAHAEKAGKPSVAVQAMAEARISLADAIRAAEAAAKGKVIEAEFKAKKDGARYEVTLLDGNRETELRIDPATGSVIGTKTATADEKPQELAAIRGAKVSLQQAIADAEAKGGRVLSAEYEHEDGRLAIELKVADASGKVTKSMVDATTGAVLPGGKGQFGDEDDEN